MIRAFKNKKGIFLNEPVVIVSVAVLTFLFLFIVLFIISNAQTPDKRQASEDFGSLNHNVMLINYLSSQTTDVPGIQNIADLIILTIKDRQQYLPKLQEITEKTLNPFFEGGYFWGVVVKEGNNEVFKIYQKEYEGVYFKGLPLFEIEQPIPSNSIPPKIYTIHLAKYFHKK